MFFPTTYTKPSSAFLLKNLLLPIRQRSQWAYPVLAWDVAAQTCIPLASPRLPRIVGSATGLPFWAFQAIHACQDAGNLTRGRGKFDESASLV